MHERSYATIQKEADRLDSAVAKSRTETFRGTARISLEALHFKGERRREPDPCAIQRKVERLREIFRIQGCLRLPPEHQIEARISLDIFEDAVQQSNVDRSHLLKPPDGVPPHLAFPLGFHLDCVSGQHRIEAAKQFLKGRDRWWTVQLYTRGTWKTLSQVACC